MEVVPVRDPTDVANARRRIVGLAVRMAYNETSAGQVAIVVTELAQNLLRHAGGGEMLACADPHRPGGIDILALDRGPGMADVATCLRDGYSTIGTSGNGLGAVKRLAHEVLIHSVRGNGVAILVRMGRDVEFIDNPMFTSVFQAIHARPGDARRASDAAAVHSRDLDAARIQASDAVSSQDTGAAKTQHTDPARNQASAARAQASGAARTHDARVTAALCVPKPGEEVCGDTAAIATRLDGTVAVLLADGLGHGPLAAAASLEAARLFQKHPEATPAAVLSILHAGLRPTRGAAVAIAVIDPRARRVTYGGIGNIAGFITDTGGTRRMVSHSGTAGHTAGRMQEFHYPMHARPVLVMFSDGLTTSWSPEGHAGLFALDPALIAGILYRDHARGRDDASVVVWKG